MINFQGQQYFDDRCFVLYLCRGKFEILADGTVETTLFHEEDNGPIWCLATYRNCLSYPLSSVLHFKSKDDALQYISIVEPNVPLVSLDGQSPCPPLSHTEYLTWKRKNGFAKFDRKQSYFPGGENPRELILQTHEQFLKAKRSVRRRLEALPESRS